MEKSDYYISCVGNLCLCIREDNPKLPPRLYFVDGVISGATYPDDDFGFHHKRVNPIK